MSWVCVIINIQTEYDLIRDQIVYFSSGPGKTFNLRKISKEFVDISSFKLSVHGGKRVRCMMGNAWSPRGLDSTRLTQYSEDITRNAPYGTLAPLSTFLCNLIPRCCTYPLGLDRFRKMIEIVKAVGQSFYDKIEAVLTQHIHIL